MPIAWNVINCFFVFPTALNERFIRRGGACFSCHVTELQNIRLLVRVTDIIICLTALPCTLSFQHFIYSIIINALVRNRCFYQIHQFIQYRVLADSKHIVSYFLSCLSFNIAYTLAFVIIAPRY